MKKFRVVAAQLNVQFFVSEKELWDLVEDLITPLCCGIQLVEEELSVCDKLAESCHLTVVI